MTQAQLTTAMSIAKSNVTLTDEYKQIGIFDGFGLPDFKRVTVTARQVASLIRWQCFQLNGGVDAEALNEIGRCGRHRFEVVG